MRRSSRLQSKLEAQASQELADAATAAAAAAVAQKPKVNTKKPSPKSKTPPSNSKTPSLNSRTSSSKSRTPSTPKTPSSTSLTAKRTTTPTIKTPRNGKAVSSTRNSRKASQAPSKVASPEPSSDSVFEVSDSSEEFVISESSEEDDSDVFMPEVSIRESSSSRRNRLEPSTSQNSKRTLTSVRSSKKPRVTRRSTGPLSQLVDSPSDPVDILNSQEESETDIPLAVQYPQEIVDTESSESDVPLATRRRQQSRRASRRRATRRRSAKKPQYEESRGYYMRRPTKDPLVLAIHPEVESIWKEMDDIEVIETKEDDQPADLKLKLLPFQREGLHWMKKQEVSEFGGGLLADEMGMGKTIQMISLLLSEPRGKPNLIVAPTVALMQWVSEIRTHTSSLKVLMYHGHDRTKNSDTFQDYDVILTTYNIIESGFRKQNYGFKRKGELIKEDSVIHKTKWFRVILDEGHYIKDRSCSTARAVFALTAERKWALSGTPLQNRVGELYSLIRFLKADPFSYYFCKKCPCKSLSWKFHNNSICVECGHRPMSHFCWWNADILKPIQNYGNVGEGEVAFQKLGKLLDRIMLRRTKVQKADDLGLPPRVVSVRRDVFNEEEEDMYTSLYSDSKRKFTTYVEAGTVLNHYANIFELITKMRLAVNHPDLILKRLPTKTGASIENGVMKNSMVCVICQDEAEDPIISKCKHVFCREDARQFLDTSIEAFPKCPSCFVSLTIDLSQPTLVEDDEAELMKAENATVDPQNGEPFRGSIVNRINMNSWRSSTKIEALVEELDRLRSQDHTIKSIVFSQFVNFLDLVYWRLNRAGFACCRLDGRMSPVQRDAIIQTFMQRHEYTVFLISLKAGGIALNLTEASRVFLCDPWWNPAVEDQAMDRIHRLGQHRPIQITRLVVENSIESRILQLQAKKHALFQSTIGKDTTALARLTEEDLKFLFVL